MNLLLLFCVFFFFVFFFFSPSIRVLLTWRADEDQQEYMLQAFGHQSNMAAMVFG